MRLFVRFSDDRRVVVRFDVAVFVLGIIIVVGVSRRHHAHEAPESLARSASLLCHVVLPKIFVVLLH